MNRTFLTLSIGSLFLVTPALLAACSGGDIAVGSTGTDHQDLKKTSDGGATGDGGTCSWDDVTGYDPSTGKTTTSSSNPGEYKVGDTFPSLDGCNTCSCTAEGILCTERACAPADGGSGSCTYGGKTYSTGATFPSTDNCNQCSCDASGNVLCTERACAYSCPTEKTIDCQPIVPAERLPLCEGAEHDWIVANCPGVTFAL